MSDHFYALRVAEIGRETDDAVAVRFSVPDELAEEFRYRPGQYLTLRAHLNGEEVRRPYSICSAPGEAKLSVGIKKVEGGLFSTFANEALQAGDQIEVAPPQGRFGLEPKADEKRSILLIAAGSGITPILSIARSVLETEPESSVTLAFGNRRANSIMFREAIEALKDRFLTRFSVLFCLSQEEQDVPILNGRVDAAKLDSLARHGLITPKTSDGIYLCGPGDMIDRAETFLLNDGIAQECIHAERFSVDGAPIYVPSSAVVEASSEGVRIDTILDGSRRGFVMSDPTQSVLEAARENGIELPFSCAGGMCCTCRCKVLEGKAEMAVNYSLEPWEMEANFTLACQARPATKRLVLDFDAT